MKSIKRDLIFWLVVYVFWTYMKSYGNITPSYCVTGLVHLFTYASVYYCLSLWQIPTYFEKGKFLRFGLSVVASSALIMVLWYLAMKGLSHVIHVSKYAIPNSLGPYLLETVQVFVPGMLLLAIESYQSAQAEKEKLAIASQKSIANELNLLKAQLNPNFLFNSLHNLQIFVDRESVEAPDMILKLSAMLDYILYKSQQERVGLQEEIDAINNFIGLEELRIGERLHVDVAANGTNGILIAPMSLLSLVEHKLEEYIRQTPSEVTFRINISGQPGKIDFNSEINKSGIDAYAIDINFEDIERQLNITYPNQHQLEVRRSRDLIKTTLQILSND